MKVKAIRVSKNAVDIIDISVPLNHNLQTTYASGINLLKPTSHMMHPQFNIKQLYVLLTLYLCVLYLSENKQRLVPITA